MSLKRNVDEDRAETLGVLNGRPGCRGPGCRGELGTRGNSCTHFARFRGQDFA
jgi:hypothetical protein